jgi:Cu2+-exporting ATPase
VNEVVLRQADSGSASCQHCGQPLGATLDDAALFCCPGCAAAHDMIETLGLGRYYDARVIDATARPLKPEQATESRSLDRFIIAQPNGNFRLDLMVEGLQCGACVWLIESVLARNAGLVEGRVNMTTRRLKLVWQGERSDGVELVASIERLGYRLAPYDPSCLKSADDRAGRKLVRALAVAGFAAGNIMLFSIGVWAGGNEIGVATRDLLHWISALIALPAIAYAGRPFFASAWSVVRHGRTNMDVPISIGVLLVTVMSLVQTIESGEHAYFDSAVTLLFFLLIGRTLDHLARRRARVAAEQLIALRVTSVTVLASDGGTRVCAAESVEPGWRMLVASGERIGVDGSLLEGNSELDQSLITGESLPVPVGPGAAVFAGTLNLGAPLIVAATATGEGTVLAECVRLIEAAEAKRGRFVALADRIARRYAPVVHLTALTTCLVWHFALGASWSTALLNAAAVLIITCPCALALAVPAVQVITTGRLFRAGILLKSPTALERLASVDTVAFDKTGTLSEPELALTEADHIGAAALDLAARLASSSRHPLARALVRAHPPSGPTPSNLREAPGKGIAWETPSGEVRLGSATFCEVSAAHAAGAPELWLARPGEAPVRFGFADRKTSCRERV